MKKTLVVLGLVACAGTVNAANWVEVAKSTTVTIYLDTTSIKSSSNSKQAWLLYDSDKIDSIGEKGFFSSKQLQSYSCRDKTFHLKSASYFSERKAGGNVVETIQVPSTKIKDNDVVPDSIGEGVWKALCE